MTHTTATTNYKSGATSTEFKTKGSRTVTFRDAAGNIVAGKSYSVKVYTDTDGLDDLDSLFLEAA